MVLKASSTLVHGTGIPGTWHWQISMGASSRVSSATCDIIRFCIFDLALTLEYLGVLGVSWTL